MPVVLQILGSVIGVAGLLMIGFGLPIRYTALDNTLIAAGITALVGGLILIGLGAGLRELRRLLRAIERSATLASAEAQPARSPRVRGPLPMPSAPMPPPPMPGGKPRPEPRLDPVMAEEEVEPPPPMPAAPLPPHPEPVAADPRQQRPSIFALVRGSRTEHYEIDETEGVPLSPAIAPRAPQPMPAMSERIGASEEPAPEPRFAEPRIEPRAEPAPAPSRGEARRSSPAALASRTAARIDMPRPVPEVPRASERPSRNLFDTVWPNEQKREPAFERTPEPPMPPMPEPRPGRGLFVPDADTAARDARDASDLAHAAVKEAFESLSLGEPEEAPARQEPAPDLRPDPKPVTILKSGVIDGMAYTLYTDGSIEAQLPTGLMRFASIDDLRTYLERGTGN